MAEHFFPTIWSTFICICQSSQMYFSKLQNVFPVEQSERGWVELGSIMAEHFFLPYLIHLILSAPQVSIEPQWVRSQYAPWMVNWKDLSNKGGQLSMWQGAVTHILDLRFSNPPSNLLAFYPHTGCYNLCRKYDIIKYPFQPRISYILYNFWL